MKIEYQPNRNSEIKSSAFLLYPNNQIEYNLLGAIGREEYVFIGTLEAGLVMVPELMEICKRENLPSREYEVFNELGCKPSCVVFIHIPDSQIVTIRALTDKVLKVVDIRNGGYW